MTIYQKLIDNLPKRIAKDILFEFAEPNANATKRWIWELLQNAKDCAFTEGVDVKIQLTDKYIEFSHNGMPFSEEDIIGLLTKDSSKTPDYSDNEKFEFLEKITSDGNIESDELQKFLLKTGKFGTGFMTTYLLSKTIHLKTVYKKDDNKFAILEIDLDRDADSLPLMEKKVSTSFEVFDKIENLNETDFISFQPRVFFTSFKYVFNDNEIAKKNAESGVQDLLKSICFTLAFVDVIKSLKLNIRGEEKIFKKVSPNLIEGINIVVIAENEEHKYIVVVSSKYNAYQIAVPINVIDEITSFLNFDEKLATQYISFPLISDDNFRFPVIVNSPLFNPTEPRDGLFIESDTDLSNNEIAIKKAKLNKKIYENVIDLYLSLLAYASKNNWQNIHFLAKTSMPKIVDKVWFKDIQQKIRVKILDSEIVLPAKGEISIKPIDTLFPYYEEPKQFEKFWNLCYSFIGNKIPILTQAEVWQDIIHPTKTEYKSWDTDFCFDIEKLLVLIQGENQNLQSTSDFFNGNIAETTNNVKKVVQFLEDEKLDVLTRNENPYCILPNLEGNYVLKDELYKNKNIPSELIETVKMFGAEYDYSKILIQSQFEEVFKSDSEKTVVKISNTVKSAIEKFIKDGKPDTNNKFLSAILNLISYSNEKSLVKQTALHKIALKFYSTTEQIKRNINITTLNAEDFDWSSANDWLTNHILLKFSDATGMKDLNSLAQLIFNRNYIPNNDSDVDEFINSIISFVEIHYKDLLIKYAIIPNQNNEFCFYNNNLYNDVDDKENYKNQANKQNYEGQISSDLKNILVRFGQEYDYKNILRHTGVSILLNEQKDTEDICKKLDEVVMKFRDSSDVNIKEAIRNLDNWISKKISQADENGIEIQKTKQSFGRFFDVRAGIAYNTLSIVEKEQSGKIIHSGYLSQLSEIVQVVGKHDEKSKNILMTSVLENLKKEDDKIEEAKFYRSLGKTVEDIFTILTGSDAKVEDNGQDFLLMTSLLEIGIRLEIKSRSKNGNFVLMTKKQVETAVNCTEKYVLCVFPDISNSTPANFKEKARFVLDIKEQLNDRYNETENFIAENIIENDNQNILLEFENKSYKYKINKLVWERTDKTQVLTFTEFEELISTKLK